LPKGEILIAFVSPDILSDSEDSNAEIANVAKRKEFSRLVLKHGIPFSARNFLANDGFVANLLRRDGITPLSTPLYAPNAFSLQNCTLSISCQSLLSLNLG
jgi:hypothetical protein